jgi:hypothetical protein
MDHTPEKGRAYHPNALSRETPELRFSATLGQEPEIELALL